MDYSISLEGRGSKDFSHSELPRFQEASHSDAPDYHTTPGNVDYDVREQEDMTAAASAVFESFKDIDPLKILVFLSIAYYDNGYARTAHMFNEDRRKVEKWFKEVCYNVQQYFVKHHPNFDPEDMSFLTPDKMETVSFI